MVNANQQTDPVMATSVSWPMSVHVTEGQETTSPAYEMKFSVTLIVLISSRSRKRARKLDGSCCHGSFTR